jgi:DNA-directed RNA polymerase beta subunit
MDQTVVVSCEPAGGPNFLYLFQHHALSYSPGRMMAQPVKPEKDDDVYPDGVQLRDFNDFDTIRSTVFDAARDQIIKAFPQKHGNLRLELTDVDYSDPDHYSLKEQKEALLKNKFLSRRLRGTVRLVDETENKVLDERPLTLMRVPYVTERGSIITNGNEYASVVQMRLLPGAYTRRQSNGELESQFNVRPKTGTPFRIVSASSASYRRPASSP